METLSSIISSFSFNPSYLSPIAILASAAIGGCIALTVAKKQRSIEFILNTKSDKKLQKALTTIRAVHSDCNTNISRFAYIEHLETEQANDIRYVLNHFEYMSVGINENIYCERILKKGMFTTVTKLFERAEPFVKEARRQSGQNTANKEFEQIANKWKKEGPSKDSDNKTKTCIILKN